MLPILLSSFDCKLVFSLVKKLLIGSAISFSRSRHRQLSLVFPVAIKKVPAGFSSLDEQEAGEVVEMNNHSQMRER